MADWLERCNTPIAIGHMVALMSVALYEDRKFSITPLFNVEIACGDHIDALGTDVAEEVKSGECNYICVTCGGRLFSHGHSGNSKRDGFVPAVFSLRPLLECKDSACKTIRAHFGMSCCDGLGIEVKNNRGGYHFAYGELAEKRRKKAIVAEKLIIKKRFSDPVPVFDLLLAETLRQKAIEVRRTG